MAQTSDGFAASQLDSANSSRIQNAELTSNKVKLPNNSDAVDLGIAVLKRVLIVDDDSWVCDIIARVLVRNKYLVTTAPSAEHALELLSLYNYDLVISDMMMSGINGLELTSRIVRDYPHLPIILITAHADTELMRLALREGASDFIPKPFNIESIPIVIERNFERHAITQKRLAERDDDVMFTAVYALAAAIDAKEPYTAQHSRRVAELSLPLADAMRISPTEKRSLELAAQVHDVGKIGIPDYILNKPGKLNDEEWSTMLLHPVQGAEIVGRVKQLSFVANVVRHHHERIDGTGYPDRLRADEIPLLSRMISVADAFEVMTSNRVYRTKCTKEEAFQALREGAGTQFDSAVVDTFIKINADEGVIQ